MTRAFYSSGIAAFLRQESDSILGELTRHHTFALEGLQRDAWLRQISVLKSSLPGHESGHILMEYSIPRMGKRVDVILLLAGVVVVAEFKIGESQYRPNDLDQVMDYALDLKNFQEQSHHRPIVPVLVATQASAVDSPLAAHDDNVFAPLRANAASLGAALARIAAGVAAPALDANAWINSAYKPTPTIVEAAQALYRGHSVKDISRSDSGAMNLSTTSDAIAEIIHSAKTQLHKAICFVTGVPGAGKTLAGLNIANQRLGGQKGEGAVFLSGNGPLVKVLREALARNESETTPITVGAARTKVQTFIQNIHHFRDDMLDPARVPTERIAVFDEAQRAWTRQHASAFMTRKRQVLNFDMSEPQFLISVMDRRADWAVIVCLVGGGQEINTGEAGLLEWLNALRDHFPHWRTYVSPNLSDAEYTAGTPIADLITHAQLTTDPRLHLAVSLRSFRAEDVSNLVKVVLDNDLGQAREIYQNIWGRYPIALTRSLAQARGWVRARARGTERFGLLASSGAHRLRPMGIHVGAQVDVIHWFLKDRDDVRSSFFLEGAATEFDVQGLELDWTCVAWDADLRRLGGAWAHYDFRGTRWNNVNAERARNLKNAYRVLLTRARQGMVIFVPHGDDVDATRQAAHYDGIFHFLAQVGFEILGDLP